MGDRGKALCDAIRRIDLVGGTSVIRTSAVYETDPWGDIPQDPYYNAVAEIRSSLSPKELLDEVLRIERDMGRVREIKYGPRRIDIDILFYGDLVLERDALQLPHPMIPERNFVLIPLAELNPALLHPVEQRTVDELRKQCTDNGGIRKTDIRLWPETRTI